MPSQNLCANFLPPLFAFSSPSLPPFIFFKLGQRVTLCLPSSFATFIAFITEKCFGVLAGRPISPFVLHLNPLLWASSRSLQFSSIQPACLPARPMKSLCYCNRCVQLTTHRLILDALNDSCFEVLETIGGDLDATLCGTQNLAWYINAWWPDLYLSFGPGAWQTSFSVLLFATGSLLQWVQAPVAWKLSIAILAIP